MPESTRKPDPIENIGERIKALREARGMSQRQLGDAAETTQVTVGRVEKGTHPVNLRTFILIAEALGVQPWELLKSEGADDSIPKIKREFIQELLDLDDATAAAAIPGFRGLIDAFRRLQGKQDGKKVHQG